MAYVHKFYTVYAFVTDVHQRPKYVSDLFLFDSFHPLMPSYISYAFSNLDDVRLLPYTSCLITKFLHRFHGERNRIPFQIPTLVLSSKIVTHKWTWKCLQKSRTWTAYMKNPWQIYEIAYQLITERVKEFPVWQRRNMRQRITTQTWEQTCCFHGYYQM